MDLLLQTPREAAIDALHAATAVYTTDPTIDELLSHIDWPNGRRRLIDPSCGDGAFIGRALNRLFSVEPNCNPDRVLSVLEGWEVHPYAAGEARHRVARFLEGRGWGVSTRIEVAHQIIRNADFLTDGPSPGPLYSVVATNPPYLRFTNVPAILRAEYERVIPHHARADLLHSFLDRCADVLTPDGEVVMVTADRWLFNVGAAALRASLGRRLGIDHLKRLDPASVFYRPKLRRAGTPPRIHPVAVVLRSPTKRSRRLGAAAIYPDADGDQCPTRTLGDIATVRLAPWLGSPGIFVVDAERARDLPPDCLVPAVDTDDIVAGLLQPARRYAIRTAPDSEPPAAVMAHLDAELPRMAPRGRRTPRWLPPETWHTRDLSGPSLLVPRIAKSLRPVRLPPGVVPINHNLSIVAATDKVTLEELEALLTSEEANRWMQARAARLEGGFYSITTTLLRALPASI